MKECPKCEQTKPFEEYQKRTASPDGLQYYCKTCQNKSNEHFRKVLRPDYWNPVDGYFSDPKRWAYIADYRRADKDIIIYMFKVKDYFYVGMTKAKLNVRLSVHRSDYKNQSQLKKIPGLHDMWDTMSKQEIQESIESCIVLETKAGDRHAGYKLEKQWIERLKQDGFKLLNSRHNNVTI